MVVYVRVRPRRRLVGAPRAPPLLGEDGFPGVRGEAVRGDGQAPPQQLPRLQDLSAARIEQRLRGYRDGSLDGTAMPRLAAPLSDEDIAALAAHFGDRRR